VLHDFDLNLLIYLDALICEQSVTKAAALVHITQPSMSLALTRLRNHFRDELLVSIGRNMVLTPLAQSLAAPVRELVLKAQLVSATVGQFEPAVSTRKFTVAASDYAIEILLNTILAGMAQEAAGVRIEMQPIYVLEQRMDPPDLIIAPLERKLPQDLQREPLWQDTWTCIVWSENRLVGDELSKNTYEQLGHVYFNSDEQITSQTDITRQIEVYVPEMSMAPKAIRATNRIATVATRLAHISAEQCSLRLLKPPIEFSPITEYMHWHRFQEHDLGAIWLRNYIRAATSNMQELPNCE
jgi:DNA-binding transcriptional LysR family regulator